MESLESLSTSPNQLLRSAAGGTALLSGPFSFSVSRACTIALASWVLNYRLKRIGPIKRIFLLKRLAKRCRPRLPYQAYQVRDFARARWVLDYICHFGIKRSALIFMRLPSRPRLPYQARDIDLSALILSLLLDNLISLFSVVDATLQAAPPRLRGIPTITLTPRFLQSPTAAA
jgi:hypothetical protein